MRKPIMLSLAILAATVVQADLPKYKKSELRIPMRDGVRLFTTVFEPEGIPGKHPILIVRTPYSVGPYGDEPELRDFRVSDKFKKAGYIFVYQDVRGRFMSEGEFVHVRPQHLGARMPHDIDESTDTYDTIEHLTKNIEDNNGRVGVWGISYPGGYAAQAAMCGHPALKAVSPQAPTANWFIGDDFHHNGALFLQDAFSFMSWFEGDKLEPSPGQDSLFEFDMAGDAYKFFLGLGPVANSQKPEYFGVRSRFWNDIMRHGHYDEYWQARDMPGSMTGIKCAVLNVGGWFDAEDIYGPPAVYAATEKQNRGIWNGLVMGPWSHGGWSRSTGESLGDILFGSKTGQKFKDEIEWPFFDTYLRGDGKYRAPEARVFETGANRWREFSSWPPKELRPATLYLNAGGLVGQSSAVQSGRKITSNPASPVPYEGGVQRGRSVTYMLADQRFASKRADVLTYRTGHLNEPITMVGHVRPRVFLKTTATDLDLVVKLIDVHPSGSKGVGGKSLDGYEQLVRGDVFRCKFRQSYSNPSPLVPGQVNEVSFDLPQMFHTFLPGHELMVQIQFSWFPLVDRNPQTFCDIYSCDQSAFQAADVEVVSGGEHASRIEFGKLNSQ